MTAPETPGTPSIRRLVDAYEVAQLLGCSSRTVMRHADAGRIPWGVKLGGMRRWDLQGLQDFIAKGCVPPPKRGRP